MIADPPLLDGAGHETKTKLPEFDVDGVPIVVGVERAGVVIISSSE